VLGFGLAVIFFIAWSVLIRNRNLEIKLKEARNRKEQSEQLSLTAAGLAHETKNPLGLIRGLAQQIKNNKNIVPEARKTAAEIMEQADITASRLGDFLSYAKERAPRFETVNAVAFIEKIINLINEDYSKAGIKIETDIDSVEITADREMLSQIMLNLLMNSLKFTGKGGTVKIIIKSRESGTSRLAVIDNGSGIPPDIIPDIFKPYVSRKSGGYGMGLAIVKRTVEQSGWSIEVKSIQDKGTKIFINGIKNAVYPGERK
jgi:signal transduction histidine kinase